jgi:hypothetical protein
MDPVEREEDKNRRRSSRCELHMDKESWEEKLEALRKVLRPRQEPGQDLTMAGAQLGICFSLPHQSGVDPSCSSPDQG